MGFITKSNNIAEIKFANSFEKIFSRIFGHYRSKILKRLKGIKIYS